MSKTDPHRATPDEDMDPSLADALVEADAEDALGGAFAADGRGVVEAELEADEGAFSDVPEALSVMVADDLDEHNFEQPADPFDHVAVGRAQGAFHGEEPPRRDEDDVPVADRIDGLSDDAFAAGDGLLLDATEAELGFAGEDEDDGSAEDEDADEVP